MNLNWGTCGDNGAWCSFLSVNLAHPHFDGKEGVYIIWQKGGPIIKVGKGRIRDKVAEDRQNLNITAFENLFLTWAAVPSINRSGVEKYLTSRLNPRIGTATSAETNPIPVNLPWPY